MGFEDRLRRIRGQAAVPEVPPVPSLPDGPTLAERLRRVSTGRAVPEPATTRTPDEAALAAVLGADILAPGVLRLERRLDARLRHGRGMLGSAHVPQHLPWPPAEASPGGSGLQPRPDAAEIGEAGSRPQLAPTAAHSVWLCLDTETSGLAGGTGTWAFLTGLLRAAGVGWCLRQYLLTRLDAEAAYLDLMGAELAPDAGPACLLTYNGRSFDAPLLTTRFRLAGRPDPLAALPHLDLLAPTRRAFARVWPDCRLATAESRLLGVQRADDLPGSAAPAAWLDWLRRGETGPLAAVLRHNRADLLSLAGLLPVLDAVYRDPAAFGADCRSVAAAHQARGDQAQALRILAANRRDLDAAGLHDLARLYRRSRDWGRAIGIWEELCARGDPEARAALARFHEHRSGDLGRALELALALPPGPERERRCRRIAEKLERAGRNLSLGELGVT
ncbi:ribonuclease H-like domain-containing protein [uncultured Thiodictyon sp.]|uniref:ribonuclease H-like domain-containing protein n=1 Tax=uncultured Thiodictyon sp. TaxID=1846217 RepID=UPI0025CD4F94|nr:ribonuclease H-like domain-containing protein [uncultured Thiodictyon sp.]